MKREVLIYSVKKTMFNRVRVSGLVLFRKEKGKGRYFNTVVAPERIIGVDVAPDSAYSLYANINFFCKVKDIEIPTFYLESLEKKEKSKPNLFSFFK